MDAGKFLPFLLLAVCTVSTVSARNGWRGPSNVRHVRRISLNEYLVPPPLARLNIAGRTGRLGNHRPIETPGYFAQLMNWLNPFSYGSPASPALLQPEAPYPPSPNFIQPPASPPVAIYNEPSPAVYDKPPLPSASFDNPTHPSPIKAKSCNPCNKVPWIPIHGFGELPYLRDASFATSSQSSSLGDYPPPANHEASHDVHQAASQEVKAPDFSFVLPLPATNDQQDGSLIGPNPHLFSGAMPPLFKAEDFNYPVKTVLPDNSEYHDAFASGNSPLADNVQPNGGQSAVVAPASPSSFGAAHEELKYIDSGANYENHNHLSFSSTRVSPHGDPHANPVSGQHGFKATRENSLSAINHRTPFGDSVLPAHESADGFYDVTGSSGPLADLSGNSSQADENPPNYGTSSFDRVPSNNLEHGYDDLFLSSNVATNSRVSLRISDGSSVKIEDPVHFEQSPLLDFTYRGESRTDSSSIPPTSNAIVDFESAESTTGTTLPPGDELFETRQGIVSTEAYSFTDPFTDNVRTINSLTSFETSKMNDSQNFNGDLHDPEISHAKDVSYISPSEQAGYLWPSILSTTLKDTERESVLWSSVVKSYDNVAKDTSASVVTNSITKDANATSIRQGVKRNKQVQVIIPYTSQYTPLPFHPLHRNDDRKITYADESNRDNYISEESRKRIKVVAHPDASHKTQTWPITLAMLEDISKKSIGTKMNNSIDVHRLQKNIDNWTIQEYSKGTTVSTISLSSANPYLFPSKQIPDEYLTTTEPINHATNSEESNVKAYTLAGFSFNELEHKDSTTNSHEESRVQITQFENSKSTESSTDASIVSIKDDDTSWQGSSVEISPLNKERVYVVTPQPIVTSPKLNQVEQKKEKTVKEIERSLKELKKTSDMKKTKKKLLSDTFESIEKAYQVLPQAVNNLAVASTGPESVPLWGLMEHEEFASLDDSEQNNENNESPDIPVLYTGHSKVSHARR